MSGEKTIREILRQPKAFEMVEKQFDSFKKVIDEAFTNDFDEVIFLGCGTSFYLASTLASYFEKFNDISAKFVASYEFFLNTDSYIKPNKQYLIVPITRVASTTETFKAVKKGKEFANVKSLAITCDEYSYEFNDYVLYIKDMFEESIVMTSSYSTMLYTGMYMSIVASGVKNVEENLRKLGSASAQFVEKANATIAEFAKSVTDLKVFIGLGTGASYGLGGEASIKVKEMCLIPTEVFSTLEYRHGPISIADEKTVFGVFVEDNCTSESVALIKELKALNSKVLAFGNITKEIAEICDLSFADVLDNSTSLPAMIIPLQLLGAYISIEKGLNPDVPRGLSKAVILK